MKPNHPAVTLCLIVKNEETCLQKCIDSARSLVSEIIVVDTGSTDQTREIAKKAGAKIVDFEWIDDFSAARNRAAEEATGEWILSLDADEVLDAEGVDTLRRWLQSTESARFDRVSMTQTTYSNNSQLMMWQPNRLTIPEAQVASGFLESPLVRLYRKDPQIFFAGLLHEEVISKKTNQDIFSPGVRIHHYGQIPNAAKPVKLKKDLYLRISKKKAVQDPQNPKGHYEYAASLWESGKLEDALLSFQKVIELFSTHVPSLSAIGTLSHRLHRLENAEASFKKALSVQPHHLISLIGLHDVLRDCGRKDEAQEILKKAMELQPQHPEILKRSSPRPTLSLCMIVKNEEKNLPACLSSVQGLVDEMILVDTGSTDATKEIAQKFGAKVFDAPWKNDFSHARNLSLQESQSDWVLVLDADEVISRADQERIRAQIEQAVRDGGPWQYSLLQTTYGEESATLGWRPNTLNLPESRGYPGYMESPLVRLFRNLPQIRFHGVIHEHAFHEDSREPVGETSIRIHHYGKYVDPQKNREKDLFYLELSRAKCRQNPNDAHAFYELGVQYWSLERFEEARDALLQSEKLESRAPLTLVALAVVFEALGQTSEAITRYARLLEVDPTHPNPYIFLPTLLMKDRNIALAEKIMNAGFSIEAVVKNPSFHINRGVVQRQCGNLQGSLSSFREALRLNAREPLALVNIGLSCMELGEWEEAGHRLDEALEFPRTRPLAWDTKQELLARQKQATRTLKGDTHEAIH